MANRDGIDVTRRDNCLIATIAERFSNIDEPAVEHLQTLLLECADEDDPPRIVVDLSNVEFFGSSFIEVLFRMWNRIHQRNGRFAVACMTAYCKEVIQITRLDQLWMVTDSIDDAVAHCASDE